MGSVPPFVGGLRSRPERGDIARPRHHVPRWYLTLVAAFGIGYHVSTAPPWVANRGKEMPSSLTFELIVNLDGANAEELHELALKLRGELQRDLPVEAELETRPSTSTRVKGDAITAGVLLLALIPAVAPKVMDLLNQWTMRAPGRSLRVKLGDDEVEVRGTSESMSELQLVVERQLRRLRS